jgi:tetratricopeptide (TPR) repeat protein
MTIRSLSCICLLTLLACGGREPPPAALTSGQARPPARPEPPRRTAPPVPPSISALAKGALLLEGLGDQSRPATVAAGEARAYFDQGLRLTYAFNHDEAARSFARAAELDPSCAMCFWGASLVLGPNYNVPMLPDRARAAWDALQRARALAPSSSPVEQSMIDALSRRYQGPDPLDPAAMAPFNVAYAEAMRTVAGRFPEDDDVQVLAAEARMDVNPWKLWALDGTPAPGTEDVVTRLERVLARTPLHVGANHYYIHAVEASQHPEKALPSAERLGALMPAAGHLVHMPAHIFQRVGRYADASAANEKAANVDVAYMERARPSGYYAMYLGHNYGFLSFSESMEGRHVASLTAAREAAKALPPAMIDMMPGMDFFVSEPLLAMVRFGAWDELLKEPRPDPKYLVLTAFWLHGHGMALAGKRNLAGARHDLEELVALAASTPEDLRASHNKASDVITLAAKVLEARIATLEKKPTSLALWADATLRADQLAYAEPDDWFYPVRHYQAAALLDARKPAEAERVYREDLRRHPHNGWALFGVWKSLAAQKRPASEVAAAKEAYEEAWKRADFALKTTAP